MNQLLAMGGGSTATQTDVSHVIISITDSGGSPLVTTAAPHGLTTGNSVNITGNSVESYNDGATITVISPTTFVMDGLSYTEDGTGGTWALA